MKYTLSKVRHPPSLVLTLKRIITVHVTKGEKYYVAKCIDLPIVSQGLTLDEVVSNFKGALELHLDGEILGKLCISPNFTVLINMELEEVYAQA